MRGRRVFAWCALLFLQASALAHAGTDTGLEFKGRDGAAHSFAELRGHPAVVTFWATWCGPCREEMPRLQKLADAYQQQGVRFVAISIDAPETQNRIDAVLAKRDFHVPVWTGANETTLSQLNLGVLVPATLILDEQGEVIGRIEGETREKDVRSRLDWLLNNRQGKRPSLVQKNDW